MSELEAAREPLRSSARTAAAGHTTAPEAMETPAATATTTAHLGTEHLHEDLRVDLHPTAAAAAVESFHGVHEVLTTIVAGTLPSNC
jgi:hypothetical protein